MFTFHANEAEQFESVLEYKNLMQIFPTPNCGIKEKKTHLSNKATLLVKHFQLSMTN
jgi:hypothetical protein